MTSEEQLKSAKSWSLTDKQVKNSERNIDHLYRSNYGRMVGILTRIFGLQHLENIEDAVQDTFAKAYQTWKSESPTNPEAWLMAAAKNRTLDLFRKLKPNQDLAEIHGSASISIHELFLDSEIEDSQLRMIFTACHPALDPRDQLAFALKTVAGFSQNEIAGALLMKKETIKKRLQRARKTIIEESLQFKVPTGKELERRRKRVYEVIYLIFNEGFHGNHQKTVIREELCVEALRLCRIVLGHGIKTAEAHALMAVMCFHTSRLESKQQTNVLLDLEEQDRSNWNQELIALGNIHMHQVVLANTFSSYHYEAAIAAEHLKAKRFEETDWKKLVYWHECLLEIQPNPLTELALTAVLIQSNHIAEAREILHKIKPEDLGSRAYLWHGCWAKWHHQQQDYSNECIAWHQAAKYCQNKQERALIDRKLRAANQRILSE